MITKEIFARQYGLKGQTRSPFCSQYLVEFKCHREDEYLIEGHDVGDLIPPLACSFSKVNPDLLAVADEEGGIMVINTLKTRLSSMIHDWLSHSNAVFDLDWAWHAQELATAGGDGTIALWDVAAEKKVCTFRGHGSSVKTVCYMPEGHDILASGARDGSVILWDRRVNCRSDHNLPVSVICDAHELDTNAHFHAIGRKKRTGAAAGGTSRSTPSRYCNHDASSQSVTSVVFQDQNSLCSAGNADGAVKVWDPRKIHATSKSKSHPLTKHVFSAPPSSSRTHGVSSISVDHTRTRLFVNSLDSVIYQYDCASWTSNPVMKYSGHKVQTFYIKQSISPDNKFLMSGSSCGSAYIWPIPLTVPAPCRQPVSAMVEMRGHISEVTAVAWCPADLCRAVTVSDDNSVWVWRMDPGVMENYDEYVTGGGTIVGTSQWLVTPEVTAEQNKVLLTPRKGTTVPPSPAKLSPAVKHSISSLQRRTPSSVIHPSSSRLISPSITSFFSRSAQSKPVVAPSPRKLIITPKKITNTVGGHSSDSGKGEMTPSVSGVKRKLCVEMGDKDDQGPSTRMRKIEDINNENSEDLCTGVVPLFSMNAITRNDLKPASSSSTTTDFATSLTAEETQSNMQRESSDGISESNSNFSSLINQSECSPEPKKSSIPAKMVHSLTAADWCDNKRNKIEMLTESDNKSKSCKTSEESSIHVLTRLILNPEDCSNSSRGNNSEKNLCKSPFPAKHIGEDSNFLGATASGSRHSENIPTAFSSPTVNLPNSVLDAQIFSPLRENLGGKFKPKTPDWLTQLRLSKQRSGEKTPKEKISGSPSSSRRKTPGKKK